VPPRVSNGPARPSFLRRYRRFFVVTAAHVINTAHKYSKTIGISDGADSFVSVHGNWISSAPVQYRSAEDSFDIAIYRLPADAVERLKS
jgi:hypothetical protein